ncbi:MAG: anion permease [Peptococcaceae bacterium]|nr:anion permease [Peptococcaceae bacterium]
MSTAASTKKDHKYIHFIVTIAIMLLFRFIPPIGSITPYGMAIIGIFIGLIYGWSVDADNLIWTSLLGLVMLGLTDYGTAGEALAAAFGNESVMLMLLAMFFIGMLQDSKLTQWMSNKLLGAKFADGKPWLLTALIVIAPALITIVVNQTLVALIMFVVYQSIFEQAGYKKGDLYPAMVLMGFMVICSVAFSLFPFRGWCLMTVGMATKAGIQLNMGGWMISEFVTLIVTCIGWMLVMFITPGCKVDKLKNIDITQFQSESEPLTKRQKAVLFILLANIIGCIVLSFAGGQEGFRLYFSKVGVYGWVIFMIALSMIWKVDGKPVLDKKTAPSYFYWDLILVVAAAMVVAGQITSETSGITPMVGKIMAPLFGLSDYMFLLALGVITFILTNVANNVAVTVTMMTIALTMAQQAQFNLQVALMVITVYGVIGLLTPAGSVNGAMIHAHNFTTTKSAYIAGAIMLIFLTAIMALVLIPMGLKFM